MGVKLQSSSGGSVEIAAPVTASNYVLTAPAVTGTILNDASSLAAAMLTGNVDVARLVSAFSGSNVSLAGSGYQKLPSGLIIQWGQFTNNGTGSVLLNFPIAFPNNFIGVVTDKRDGSYGTYTVCGDISLTAFWCHFLSNISGTLIPDLRHGSYIAIGY